MRKIAIAVAALAIALPCGARAESINIGASLIANCAPIAIALDKHYFEKEGLTPKITTFVAQAPVAVAVASGALDFGDAAQTAALYNLASAGREQIIAGGAAEAPTFHSLALLVSNQAYAAGLKSARDLPGHSFALTQMGTGLQYSLGKIARKFGFNADTIKLLPLQSNPNIASALAGGRADAAVLDTTNAMPLIESHQVTFLGWVGDMTSYTPAYLVYAGRNIIDQHPDTVRKFLAAYRNAVRDYDDAFTDSQGRRHDGATAAQTLSVIADWIQQPAARVKLGLPYFDRRGRVDMAAIQDQLNWYFSIGAIKKRVLASDVVDRHFAETTSLVGADR